MTDNPRDEFGDRIHLHICPFCGNDNIAVSEMTVISRTWAECLTCGAAGPEHKDRAAAAEAWNARIP